MGRERRLAPGGLVTPRSAPGGTAVATDAFGRPLRALRISVTDRCNLRCRYCMPEASYTWLPRASLLSFEEIARLARVFAGLGVDKFRITGGEPLLRAALPALVAMLAPLPGLRDLALTTNGTRLAEQAAALRDAGLQRVTVSLDTLRADRLYAHARTRELDDILAGIDAAAAAGFASVKLNVVAIRGLNEDELGDLLAFGMARSIEVRFIEYMDVGGATQWRMDDVVPADEIVARLSARFGTIVPEVRDDPAAPAETYRLADGTRFGIIASTTRPFCRDCDRARLTADGTLFTCLYGATGTDLRAPLRDGTDDAGLASLVAGVWGARHDRGAEARAQLERRGALLPAEVLRTDPHAEMHVRGG
jgi:cyclic pyranopterin phosphate synthase